MKKMNGILGGNTEHKGFAEGLLELDLAGNNILADFLKK